MSGRFYICEPYELNNIGFAASELDFLSRELRLGERKVIVLADGEENLHFILSSVYKSLGAFAVFTPKKPFSVACVPEYPDIRRELAISVRAASVGEKDGSAVETVSALLNMELYIAGPRRTVCACEVIMQAARFVGIASALLDEMVNIKLGNIASAPDASARFDRAAFAVFLLSHIGFESVLFSAGENGVEVSLRAPRSEKATPSAELVRALLKSMGLSVEVSENEVHAQLSRKEVSLIGLKQDPPIEFQ